SRRSRCCHSPEAHGSRSDVSSRAPSGRLPLAAAVGGDMAELTRRYIVMQIATEGPFDIRDVGAPFVLQPWKDPAALHAPRAYRDHCYDELARELGAWIEAIEGGPHIRGGVGSRNEHAVASRPRPAAREAAKRKAKATHKKPLKKKAKRRS